MDAISRLLALPLALLVLLAGTPAGAGGLYIQEFGTPTQANAQA